MQHVDVKVHENVATILIDRPERRNALAPTTIEDLKTAFSDVHQEKRVQAVVLTAAGDQFCAGLDLHVMQEIAELPGEESMPQWFATWNHFTELLEQMLRFPKPVIAAVDGGAYGAGLALALTTDIVVVSDRASFSANAVRRGLVGSATAALLTFRFGAAIAARMSLTGESIDASEAYRLGMCGSPVNSNQIWVAATEQAKRCAAGPREAVQATKRAINESIGESMITQLAAGAASSATACTTSSAAEGLKAFHEKRDPNWDA